MRKACALVLIASACIEQETPAPTAEDLEIARRDILTTEPTPRFKVNAELEDKIVYLGLDVDPATPSAGKAVKLTHYWKVFQPVGDEWKLFVHLGPQGAGFVNADHSPVRGRYPVSYWKAGEIIRDTHSVSLPAKWTDGHVDVYVGLWKGSQRLRVVKGPNDGQNRVLAAKVPVSGSAKVRRLRYLARRTDTPIKVDGKLDEPAWQSAPFTEPFVNTMTGAKVPGKTQVKMLWDDDHLYVAFSTDDADVASEFKNQDDHLWTQDAVELFIDADGDGKDYVEIQASPAGVLFDSYLPARRQNQNDWQSGSKTASKVNGTLGKRDDKDSGFTTEIAVPIQAAKGRSRAELKKPEPGRVWRVNMFRMDLDEGKPQKAVAWSPPMVGDFHVPARFGELVFTDAAGKYPEAKAKAKAVPETPEKKAGEAPEQAK